MVTCQRSDGNCVSADCFDAGRCVRPWAMHLLAQRFEIPEPELVAADFAEVMSLLVLGVEVQQKEALEVEQICPAYFDQVFSNSKLVSLCRRMYRQLYVLRGEFIEKAFLGSKVSVFEKLLVQGVMDAAAGILQLHPSPSRYSRLLLQRLSKEKVCAIPGKTCATILGIRRLLSH